MFLDAEDNREREVFGINLVRFAGRQLCPKRSQQMNTIGNQE